MVTVPAWFNKLSMSGGGDAEGPRLRGREATWRREDETEVR